jgi:GNAT superfamily N-acetyltransferase
MRPSESRCYELRVSHRADFEFVFALNETTMRPLVELLRGWNEAKERAEMLRFFSPGSDSIIVVDGQDAGHLKVEEDATRTHLRMIALLPSWQGKGIGTQIIRDLMYAAHARSVPLTLWVSALNHRAQSLYERLGFQVMRAVDFDGRGVKIEMGVWPDDRKDGGDE